MTSLDRDPLFVALTRPQMLAGVTYSLFVANAIVATELFLIFRSAWVVVAALVFHGIASLLCLRDPFFFELWLIRTGRCPRVPNRAYWGCNSFRP